MNTNPNAVSLTPQLSDKQYIEPIQLGNILNIINVDQPDVVFLPGNRHYLSKQLKQFTGLNVVVLPPDQKVAVYKEQEATAAVDLFIQDDEIIPVTTLSFFNHNNRLDLHHINDYQEP
ncbi:hypothetical protein [Lentilactobacillus rapi]|nr:hypothetical protein [Lentilactobacillus rapi]